MSQSPHDGWTPQTQVQEQPRECPFCGGLCADGDCTLVFTPIIDCEHKNASDGCCSHPKNMTPECHVGACPRLHRRIKI